MKILSELLTRVKLDEILLTPLQPSRGDIFKIFDKQGGKQVGTGENNPVFHYESAQHPGYELYVLKQEGTDNIVAYLFGVKWVFKGKDYLVVKDARTMPKYQKMGYMTALYHAINHKHGVSLISDEEQSSPMRKVWRSAHTVLDTKSHTFISRKEVSEDELYTVDKTKDPDNPEKLLAYRYRLVFEGIQPWKLGDIPQCAPGILRDNLICTHTDNEGKYE